MLSSTRGVARRARLLLSGSVQAFKYVLEKSSPSDRGAHYLMSETRRQKRTEQRVSEQRVSELIKSCDLSRALNALAGSPRQEVTDELIQKIRDLHPDAEPEHCIPQSAPTRILVAPNDRIYKENVLAKNH